MAAGIRSGPGWIILTALGWGLAGMVVGVFALWLVFFGARFIGHTPPVRRIDAPGGDMKTAATSRSKDGLPQPCDSRIVNNVVLISCPGTPARAAWLAGVRTKPGTKLMDLVVPLLSTPPATIQLRCLSYQVSAGQPGGSDTISEDVAFCGTGGDNHIDDIAIPLLLSGDVSVVPDGALSRRFLAQEKRLQPYLAAQRAAQHERLGMWWDYVAGGGADVDPIAWRMARDAQLGSDASVITATQAWIASLMVLGGAAAGFLYQFTRDRRKDKNRRDQLHSHVTVRVDDIRRLRANRDVGKATERAKELREWLGKNGASEESIKRWDAVIAHLRSDTDTYKEAIDQFREAFERDPVLDAGKDIQDK